jgi:rhamnulokinase
MPPACRWRVSALEGTAVGNLASQLIALRAVKDLPTFRRHLGAGLKQKVYSPRR